MMSSWRVIYPGGDRNMLSIAFVYSDEESDYDIASRKEFDTEEECEEYAIALVHKYSLKYKQEQKYLD
jgi:hypothetical protein